MSSKALNYKGRQGSPFKFYMMPKELMEEGVFKKLSLEAKVIYGLMLDRVELSIQNNWVDERGDVYIIFTVESVQEIVNCSKNKAMKILKELDIKNGIGLIERKKSKGMGKPDTIYVKDFICLKNDEDSEYSEENKNVQAVEVEEVDVKEVDVEDLYIQDDAENTISIGVKNEPIEVQNLNLSGAKNEPVVVQNLNPNNTNILNTNINNIKSNQINSKKEDELNGFENNKLSILEIKKQVTDDINSENTLPYKYTQPEYHRHLKQAIYTMTDYDKHKNNCNDKNISFDDKCKMEDYFSSVHIFCEALSKMLSTQGNLNVGGRMLNYAKVYDTLSSYIQKSTVVDIYTCEKKTKLMLSELMELAISNYRVASKINQIKYPTVYMMSCLWTAMEDGDAKVYDAMRHDFG